MKTLNYKKMAHTNKEKMNVIYEDLLEIFKMFQYYFQYFQSFEYYYYFVLLKIMVGEARMAKN